MEIYLGDSRLKSDVECEECLDTPAYVGAWDCTADVVDDVAACI